jgi:D-ribose pyranose/furanose isomerase RbsD
MQAQAIITIDPFFPLPNSNLRIDVVQNAGLHTKQKHSSVQ